MAPAGTTHCSPPCGEHAEETIGYRSLAPTVLEGSVNIVHEKCAGIDVGKDFVMCCALVGPAGGKTSSCIERFDTTTGAILKLADWLTEKGVTHVVMESTGVYWKPLYNLLEGQFVVWLVNAQHVKGVPGRKTDVEDCRWLADLMRHGLLKPSFIPPPEIRALRELTRYRRSMIQERSREANRVQKLLEDANIKLGSVASDVLGKSARKMLRALIAGSTDVADLAEMAHGRLRNKRDALKEALTGKVQDHHRFLLRELLDHVEYLERTTERLDGEIAEKMRPFEAEQKRLDAVPGLNVRNIQDLIAELGVDMTRFPSSAHCSSWAGICPANNESAGKRHRTRLRKGSVWLRTILVQAAWAAVAKKTTYYRAQFARLKGKRGPKKAIVAVAHSMLETVYALLKHKDMQYADLGVEYFLRRDKDQLKNKLVKRLGELGFDVTLSGKQPA